MAFDHYGRFVARHPLPFIIIPVILTFICTGGFYFMTRLTDIEYLFTPETSTARNDQRQLQREFNSLKKNFDPARSLETNVVARVIITSQDGGNIWNGNTLEQVVELNAKIKVLNVENCFKNIRFSDICVKVNGTCFENSVDFLNAAENVTFPFFERLIPDSVPVKVFLGNMVGGVATNTDGYIQTASAIQLIYFLEDSVESESWSTLFVDTILNSDFELISAIPWTHYSTEIVLDESTQRIVPMFSVCFVILITFSVVSCILLDPVRSKPFLGKCKF